MKLLSAPIKDQKLDAYNMLLEMSLEEYYNLVSTNIDKNEFQRNRVRSSKTIYSLLKQDLINGCLMPPVVLSISDIDKDIKQIADRNIRGILDENKYKIFILDGLQRTFTIQDILRDVEAGAVPLDARNNTIRVEVYIGLCKEGVLYRMLTLNTGQTPMSLRHQIEIIYSNLSETEGKYKLYPDTVEMKDGDKVIGNYKFSDAIDAFTSYMESDYLQITREKLLTTIKSFDKLKQFSKSDDTFSELISLYTGLVNLFDNALKGFDYISELSFSDNPFGRSTYGIFSRSQPMTGFGAAISRLIELDAYHSITSVNQNLPKIDRDSIKGGIVEILEKLNDIKNHSKKIGNSQRYYFYLIFKYLLDPEVSCFGNLNQVVDRANQAYKREFDD